MKLFKNIIEDAVEYNNTIAKFNSKGQLVDIEEVEVNKVITISLTNETTILNLCEDGIANCKEEK